jgi:hypothetical protein
MGREEVVVDNIVYENPSAIKVTNVGDIGGSHTKKKLAAKREGEC